METQKSRCWAEIDLSALVDNCRVLHSLIPAKCRLMNIVKGDAYGHGAGPSARALAAAFPEDWFGVACLSEALELRRSGIRQEILILGYTPPEEAVTLAEHTLTQALLNPDYTAALSREAVRAGVTVQGHLALDTGMTRIGYDCYTEGAEREVSSAMTAYAAPGVRVSGIFTHFSSSYGKEEADLAYTHMQYQRFAAMCRALAARGVAVGLRHCCNSPATVNHPEYAMDMCRAGTVLYGWLPEKVIERPVAFRRVMTWKARVAMLREVSPGTAVSYNRTAVTDRAMRLAVVTAGDCDGYFRGLSNLGRVRIRGQVCPVVGRVCMDMLMADVTHVPEVSEGDEVLLLGGPPEAEVPCAWLYEPLGLGPSAVTCNLRARVPRVYKQQ